MVIKKISQSFLKGYNEYKGKNEAQDYSEAVQSINRGIELIN